MSTATRTAAVSYLLGELEAKEEMEAEPVEGVKLKEAEVMAAMAAMVVKVG